MKKATAFLLSIVMIITAFPVSAFAEDNESIEMSSQKDCAVSATNSLGEVISTAINESNESENTDPDTHICDVDVQNGTVDVDLICDQDCNVFINIIDEKTEKTIASGIQSVASGAESAQVELNSSKIPDNYIVEAALLDDGMNLIGSAYVDSENTEWYRDFQDLTVDDFDSDLVLNLDAQDETNFMVFMESVVFVDDGIPYEEVESTEEDIRIYNFYCDEDAIQQLEVGSTFCCNKSNAEEIILGKVDDIEVEDGFVEVTAGKVTIEECFQIVKINYDSEEYAADSVTPVNRVGASHSVNATLSFKKDLKEFAKNLKGSLTGSFKFGLTLEYSLKDKYIKVTFSTTPSVTFSVTYSVDWIDKEWLLQWTSVPTGIVGLTVDYKLYFYAKGSISGSFNATVQRTLKWSFGNKEGFKDLSSKTSFSGNFKVEASFEIGLKPYFALSLIYVWSQGYSCKFGISISASQQFDLWNTGTEKHTCTFCVDGDINFVLSQSARMEINALIWHYKKEIPIPGSIKVKLGDFYWSITHGEAGWGECDHKAYKKTIKVLNENGKVIQGAKINGKATSNGTYTDWFDGGQHKVKVTAAGYVTKNYSFAVDSAQGFIYIVLRKATAGSSEVDEEVDSSYLSFRRRSGNGFSTALAPLTYTEPYEGVTLSTALATQRRSDVAWVQRELKNLGYNIPVDGYYGNRTAAAVRQFQADYELPVTGTVNANVVAIIKHPVKNVGVPANIRLTTSAEISSGAIASVAWDAVAHATAYDVFVYNSAGEVVDNDINTKATVSSFVLYTPDTYTIKIRAKNDRFTGTQAALGTTITVRDKITVRFLDWDGTLLSKQFVEFGQGAITPAAPERDGYTFLKWDKDYSKPSADIDVNALYNPNQYTVTFLNTDGNVLSSAKYTFEESAVAPEAEQITVPAGSKFIGWDRNFSCITEDITIRPVIQYKNDDLPIIIESYTVEPDEGYGYNVAVTIRNYDKKRTNGRVVVALKTSDNRFVTMTESSAFTLAKSDFSTNTIQNTTLDIFVPCNEDIAYIDIFVVAAYDDLIPISEVARYDVLQNSDVQNPGEENTAQPVNEFTETIQGTVDASLSGKQAILFIYKKGDAADFTNETVAQTVIAEDGNYQFDFVLREEPSVDTGDFTVVLGIEGAEKAIFLDKIEAPKPVYTVTIKDFDGSVISTQQVVQGDCAVLPEENPEREGYIFAGWDYSNSSIYEDLNITAIYVPKVYTVVFIDWTNRRFDMETYRYGETLIAPDLNSLDEYNALGWENLVEGTVVTRNMVITAKYEKKTYTVKFYDYEQNVIDEQVVEYGGEAVIPVLEDDAEHIFYAWNSEDLDYVVSSLEVHPYFRYVENTAVPTVSLDSGIYSDSVELSFADTTDQAIIFYSVNNGDFIEYTDPVVIDETAEISCYATSLGRNDSAVLTNYYVINKAGDNDNWKYPVRVYDSEELIGVYLLPAGTPVNADSIRIERTGYILEGFCSDADLLTFTDDSTLNAAMDVYAKFTPEQYTVNFKDADGEIINSLAIDYLGTATPPDVVEIPEGFIFVGWDTDDYYCVTQDIDVHAMIAEEKAYAKISLNRNTYTIMEGYSYSLTATVQGADGMEVFWQSNDESIATVDENGRVTALEDGVVAITATIPEKGIYDTCYIKVTENPAMSVKLIEQSKYTAADDYIVGISPSDNYVETVRAQIEAQKIKFLLNETELLDDDIVVSGTIVRLYDSDGNVLDEKTLVVSGDVDGDGYAGLSDASRIMRSLINKENLEGCYLLAADVNGDGDVNNRDASVVMRYNVNKETI